MSKDISNKNNKNKSSPKNKTHKDNKNHKHHFEITNIADWLSCHSHKPYDNYDEELFTITYTCICGERKQETDRIHRDVWNKKYKEIYEELNGIENNEEEE